MKWKFAFGLASDDTFFVTTRRDGKSPSGVPFRSKMTAFLDEDEFLAHLIRAGLREEQTTRMAVAVLLAIAKPVSPPPWTVLDLSRRQMETLHLEGAGAEIEPENPVEGKHLYLQAARSGALPQFYDLLMQSPAAVAMLLGSEHRLTFSNASFLELFGATSVARLTGKTLGEAFPEFHGGRILEIISRVYETGRSYHSNEEKWSFYRERTGRIEESYFNTICQPICNAFGEVAGVLVQGTDVTDMVLARDVREHRERLLYRQWAELEAIYRSTPVAMMLIDTRDFRILRLNEMQADLLGHGIHELLGKPLLSVAGAPANLLRILREVLQVAPAMGQTAEKPEEEDPVPQAAPRYRLKSYAPILSAAGNVESIILVGLEFAPVAKTPAEARLAKELVSMS